MSGNAIGDYGAMLISKALGKFIAHGCFISSHLQYSV